MPALTAQHGAHDDIEARIPAPGATVELVGPGRMGGLALRTDEDLLSAHDGSGPRGRPSRRRIRLDATAPVAGHVSFVPANRPPGRRLRHEGEGAERGLQLGEEAVARVHRELAPQPENGGALGLLEVQEDLS